MNPADVVDIHSAVDKINKVTTRKQTLRGCKPRPMKNKLCVGVYTNKEQALRGCKSRLMKNKHCVSEESYPCEPRVSFKTI